MSSPPMNPAWNQLVYAVLIMGLASTFNTLLASFTVTGHAGIDRLRERYPKHAERFKKWAGVWRRLQATHLFLTVISQIGCIVLASRFFLELHARTPQLALGGAVAFVILYTVLVKVFPIAASEHFADRITVAALPATVLLSRMLIVFSYPIAFLERWMDRRLDTHAEEEDSPSERDEILSLVEQTEDSELDDEEREIIRSVFDFGETVVREIMTPRVDIQGIEAETPVNEAASLITESRFSRFPVYRERVDEMVGLCHSKDVLRALQQGKADAPITAIMKEPLFVPESMPISDLLALLKRQKVQAALVVDEYGGTAGLVSIEDIVEELVGEIDDEYDTPSPSFIPLQEDTVLVEARTPVDEVNDHLGIAIPEEEEYDSLGGFIFHTLGRIPHTGETIAGADFELVVTKVTPRKIQQVKVIKRAAMDSRV